VLNDDGLFLDNWSVNDLEEKLGKKIHVFTEPIELFAEVVTEIQRQ
jgi:hypothetical protein